MPPNFSFPFRRHNNFLKVLALFLVLIIGGLITFGVMFTRARKSIVSSSTWVDHTLVVLARVDSILLLAQSVQWETRNYSLTGDSSTYKAYCQLRDSLISHAKSFKALVVDNVYQYSNAIKLEQQVGSLVRFTDESMRSKRNFTENTTYLIPLVKQHIILHDSVTNQVRLIKEEENRLLASRRADAVARIEKIYKISAAAGILIFLLLVGTFAFVFYHLQRRQRAEKELIESERKFQTLINSTEDLAIFLTDDKGNILDCYAGARKMKGYNRDEVIGKSLSIFYTEEAIQAGEPQQNLALAAQQGSFETEGWRVRKDGSRFWADVLITAVYDENKSVAGFTKVTRDFSLHKRAEEEAKSLLQKEKDLNRMKSSFVSIASHEFRTPLSTILSSVSLLEKYKTTETQSSRERHIARIKASIKELVSTLDEFLSLEKIEEGKVEPKRELFNVKELSEHLQLRFNTLLKPGQVIHYNHFGSEDVFLDEVFMNHILNNLLSNAVKYSPDATEIIFETRVESSVLTVKVKDQGIGIPEKDQKHLFERFFRASNTGSVKGTGLGLHITKKFIDLMDGEMYVNSDVDRGTEVTVMFALSDSEVISEPTII
jgi:PAS domain S-box-containing protein